MPFLKYLVPPDQVWESFHLTTVACTKNSIAPLASSNYSWRSKFRSLASLNQGELWCDGTIGEFGENGALCQRGCCRTRVGGRTVTHRLVLLVCLGQQLGVWFAKVWHFWIDHTEPAGEREKIKSCRFVPNHLLIFFLNSLLPITKLKCMKNWNVYIKKKNLQKRMCVVGPVACWWFQNSVVQWSQECYRCINRCLAWYSLSDLLQVSTSSRVQGQAALPDGRVAKNTDGNWKHSGFYSWCHFPIWDQ